jgi:Fic family protein
MKYNWQQSDWPDFRFDVTRVSEALLQLAEHSGRVGGLIAGLPEGLETEAILDLMIAEAIKSSAIEGEMLDEIDVMSSIRNHLGLNTPRQRVHSRQADGAGELVVAVRTNFEEPLTEQLLFEWHKMLLKGERGFPLGEWRSGDSPMQVVSGALHKLKVHFEAPPSKEVGSEMARFIDWFNRTAPAGPEEIRHAPIRSAIAHVYFESIHPFEDGNGRIGRAVSEKALSQGLHRPVLLSLSQTIEANRNAYYAALQLAQGSNEITAWIEYFVGVVLDAQLNAEARIEFVLKKSKFFQRYNQQFTERHLKALNRMLAEGPSGFTGGMNARKYVAITGVSKATATRDLQELAKIGALTLIGAGRSAKYELNL